jgi:hypothetical protein
MIINTIVLLLFGIAFVVAPAWMVSFYGVTADAPLKHMGNLLGSALLGLAVISWLARNAGESEARRAIVWGMFLGDTVGFIMALIAQLQGVLNALGWLDVAIYLLLALGFGYFAILKSGSD